MSEALAIVSSADRADLVHHSMMITVTQRAPAVFVQLARARSAAVLTFALTPAMTVYLAGTHTAEKTGIVFKIVADEPAFEAGAALPIVPAFPSAVNAVTVLPLMAAVCFAIVPL